MINPYTRGTISPIHQRLYNFSQQTYYVIFLIALFFSINNSAPAAFAHDATLTINRTEPNSLKLIFLLDAITALQPKLMPQSDPIHFLIQYTNMLPNEFEKNFIKEQLAIEGDIRIDGPDGSVFTLEPWQWPSANETQNHLRQTVQSLLNDPTKAWQQAPIIVSTIACSKSPVMRIRISLGRKIRPILLVRPNVEQFWIDDLSPDAMIDF